MCAIQTKADYRQHFCNVLKEVILYGGYMNTCIRDEYMKFT